MSILQLSYVCIYITAFGDFEYLNSPMHVTSTGTVTYIFTVSLKEITAF